MTDAMMKQLVWIFRVTLWVMVRTIVMIFNLVRHWLDMRRNI